MEKIKDGEFFMLETEEADYVSGDEDKAIEKMKSLVGDKENPEDEEGVMLWSIDTNGEKVEMSQVPWSKIAMRMMKGEQ